MTTNTTPAPVQAVTTVVVVTCPCGNLGLEEAMHRTPQQAWNAAAAHVERSRGACAHTVAMHRDTVPAMLAAGLPR